MKRFGLVRFPAFVCLAALLAASCSQVPLTNRSQLNLVSQSSVLQMSADEYQKFLSEHKLSTDAAQTAMVKRVGERIQHAVESYFADEEDTATLEGYHWEFNLVVDPAANAWCMPGGRVVVYTGILPVTQDEAGLAVVLSHEIAHAVANHGRERMSQQMVADLGETILGKALAGQAEQTSNLFLSAYKVGSQVGVLLPWSRQQESEADHLGLIFMAMAGYDPNAAVAFWERMAKASAGSAPPQILSTHPSDATRIDDIKKLLPEAMKHYKKV